MIDKILDTIKSILGLGTNLTNPEQYDIKKEKLFRAKCEAAESFIRVTMKIVPYEDIGEKNTKKEQRKFARKFFDIDV